jgi:hypothetical protein
VNWEFSKGECCSEGKIVTSDDKKQKDKPKLVPHQNVQVAGEKVKKAKRSSEITKGQSRSEDVWFVVGKGERIGV